jgi:cell division protein FtsW
VQSSSNPRNSREKYINFFHKPTAAYLLICASTALLTGLGVVMVLSSSSVKAYETTGSTYSIFYKQLLFIGVGGMAMYLAIHLKRSIWEKISRFALIVGGIALLLPQAPIIGKNINGNRSWIGFGSFTLQPSEFAKLVLVLWCAMMLRRFHERDYNRGAFDHLKLLAPGGIIFLVFIMAGNDLGSAIIVMGIIFAMLFISGLEMAYLLSLSFAGFAAIAFFVIKSPNRLARFTAVLHPFSPGVYKLAGWQTAHSIMGLASGGFFGVGLGASRQKWANLAEANTDFIFSVIGEEMGLLGTLIVLLLYAALIYGIFRTALHTKDLLYKYACAGIGAWFLLQVAVNIGSDIGLLPVVGVTLPFVSYGGSSLLANFIAIGFVLSVIRRDPEVRAALRSKRRSQAE